MRTSKRIKKCRARESLVPKNPQKGQTKAYITPAKNLSSQRVRAKEPLHEELLGLQRITPREVPPRQKPPYFPPPGTLKRVYPTKTEPCHEALIDAYYNISSVFKEISKSAPAISNVFRQVAVECPVMAILGFSLGTVAFQNAAFALNSMSYSDEVVAMLIKFPFSKTELEDRILPLWSAVNTISDVTVVLSRHLAQVQGVYCEYLSETGKIYSRCPEHNLSLMKEFNVVIKYLKKLVDDLATAFDILRKAQGKFLTTVKEVDHDAVIPFTVARSSSSETAERSSSERSNRERSFMRALASMKKVFENVNRV